MDIASGGVAGRPPVELCTRGSATSLAAVPCSAPSVECSQRPERFAGSPGPRSVHGCRHISRGSTSSVRTGARLPLVTVLLCTMAVVSYSLDTTVAGGAITAWMANTYEAVFRGEWWRLFTYWMPHSGITHLSYDIPYLAIAGSLAEFSYGGKRVLAIFLVASLAGGILAACCDPWYGGVVGSSAGTHGLLAYYCARQLVPFAGWQPLRGVYLIILCYLAYITVWALCYGTMGWPFEFFPNGGCDHLGGIGAATVWVLGGELTQLARRSGAR